MLSFLNRNKNNLYPPMISKKSVSEYSTYAVNQQFPLTVGLIL